MGRKSVESLRLLQGQFCDCFPPHWKRTFLALEDAGREAWCGDRSSYSEFRLSFRAQQTFSAKGQGVSLVGFWPIWCLSQLLSPVGVA